MADGIRIKYLGLVPGHPFTVRVPHPGDPSTGRTGKDYFIRLDSLGYAIVSTGVWTRLQEANKGGFSPLMFEVDSPVTNPPTQGVGRSAPAGDAKMMRQIGDAIEELDPRKRYNDIRFQPSRPRLRLHHVRKGGVEPRGFDLLQTDVVE